MRSILSANRRLFSNEMLPATAHRTRKRGLTTATQRGQIQADFLHHKFRLIIYRFVIHYSRFRRSSRPVPEPKVGMRGTPPQVAAHPVILIVEDMDSLRQSMQEILEDADFLVLPAANTEQALALAQSCAGPIHLLITPPHPDGMPGPDLAGCLRQRSPEMSVLYSSANPLAALEVPDPAEVVSSMIPRPFTKRTLLQRINILLSAHS